MDTDQLNARNMQVCFLTQAMCGAVTPNWRSVSMAFNGNEVQLYFVLERESAEDREEIQDVADQFSIFQEDTAHYRLSKFSVVVTGGELSVQNSAHSRLVYRRKELP